MPMVGPVMLDALLAEDIYLAGSMLMVMSVLGVFGTLVSDLLLLWLDPRIRIGGSVLRLRGRVFDVTVRHDSHIGAEPWQPNPS